MQWVVVLHGLLHLFVYKKTLAVQENIWHYFKEFLIRREKMVQRTITRADIADAIYSELGFSHAESFKLIEQILANIIEALADGETVKLSKFATFIPHAKKERVGRNPKTGEKHAITPRIVLSFKASNSLKNALKSGTAC